MSSYLLVVATAIMAFISGVVSYTFDYRRTNFENNVRRIVEQAAQYVLIAGQDTNPVIGILHSAYATSYISAARIIFGDTSVDETTGCNSLELENMARDRMGQCMRKLHDNYPDLVPNSNAAIASGWVS